MRKYDDFAGRFFQIDPMWEKYYGWTPYHYCRNNPVSKYDDNGLLERLANGNHIEQPNDKYSVFLTTEYNNEKIKGDSLIFWG